jgi:xanthine/uracil permease
MAIIVPPSLGMWVFGATLVGLPASSMGRVLAGAFLAVGLSTLLQLALGWRVPVFEGPASIHLATVVVIAATKGGTAPIAEITGGLLVAGAVVFVLGAIGADRVLIRIFTPAATATFVLALVVVLAPDATAQAIGRSNAHPVGTAAAWFVLVVAVVAGALAYLRARLRPFALLIALIAGVGARFIMGWPTTVPLGSGWTFPHFVAAWPRFTFAATVPFALAGVAAAFNVVGSLSAMSSVETGEVGRPRHGLVMNGLIQGIQSGLVGFVGTVGHLESASVVRMIGHGGRRSLAIAAAGLVALSFVDPVVRALATIPAHISGTLLLVLMLVLCVVGIEIVRSLPRLVRWGVVVPALVPAVWWVVFRPSTGGFGAALNPMVLAVAVALVAERLVTSLRRPPAEGEPGSFEDTMAAPTPPSMTEGRVAG